MKYVKLTFLSLALLPTIIVLNPANCRAANTPGDDLPPAYNQPLNPDLQALILPEVRFQNADLAGALQYLADKAKTQSSGAIQVQYVLLLPDDFQPRAELTLDLKSISVAQALQYLGQLAGIKFTAGPHAIIARVDPAIPPAPPVAAATPTPKPGFTHTTADFTNRLNQPATPSAGSGAWFTLDGKIDPSRSGYIPHRGLDGRSVGSEPDPFGKDPIGELQYQHYRNWVQAQAKPNARQPITPLVRGWFDTVTYPVLNFDKVPLSTCIDDLQRASVPETIGGTGVNFVIDRGVDATEPITLHLANVPLLETLRYLSALGGVEFSPDQYAINVKPLASGGGLGMPQPATLQEINELQSITLPGFAINRAPLDSVMQALTRVTSAISNGKTQLHFINEPGLDTSAAVTLNLTNIPLPEALQYIGELANVNFIFQRYAIWVERKVPRN